MYRRRLRNHAYEALAPDDSLLCWLDKPLSEQAILAEIEGMLRQTSGKAAA